MAPRKGESGTPAVELNMYAVMFFNGAVPNIPWDP
jgi:hypothetical protein